MFKSIKHILENDYKMLKRPILLLAIDSVFNMFFYAMLYLVIMDLLADTFTAERVRLYTGIMVVAFILRIIINKSGYHKIQVRGSRAVEKLRIRMGDHIRNLNLGYFNKNSIGELTNILTNDLQDFEKVLTHSTSDLIKTVALSVYLLLITFAVDAQLAIIQICVMLLAIPVMLFGGRHVERVGQDKKKIIGVVISRMVEYLRGMQEFKAHNMVGEKFERLEKSFKDFKRESIRAEVVIVPFILLFQVIVDLSFPFMLLIATQKLVGKTIDYKAYLTFVIINIALTNTIRAFAAQYGEFRYMKLALKKLLRTYKLEEMPYKTEIFQPKTSDISFENVSFSYEEDKATLYNVSFEAKSGTVTALVGPSGSGKTTITSLIARFWDIDSGKITIGGTDIRDVKPDTLLRHISMVFQDVYLLNDTVLNNIMLGNPKASRADVINAAKEANCHAFIMALENGYDTVIGEGGSTLSGGEKQRISIARALLKDASIILLDEATASLDADNEQEIRKAIQRLTKNKTVMVIAHRLNTIKDSDQIVVLSEGKIEEAGTHHELIKAKGHYFAMYSEMENARDWALV